MRVRYIIVGVAGLALAGGAAFYLLRPMPTVKVSIATLGPISEFVYATGTVEPIQLAKVVPLQRRRVVELCRCEGQMVKKGQVLGRQDDAEERALLREMEIRHQQLVRDRDRAEKDKVAKAEIEQRESAVKEASSRINAQNSRIGTLAFQAPMDGMILRRDGEVGEIAGPTDVLFWVGKPSPLQVAAEINEEDITKIAIGQPVFLSSEAFERQQLRASVSHITPKGDPTKKTFRVYMLLPNNSPLRIGMTVEANIVYREKQSAVVVPVDALIGNTVHTVGSDGSVRRVQVTAGIRGSKFVEIVGGISANTMVVSPARPDLADGARVMPEGAVQTAAMSPAMSPTMSPAMTSGGADPGRLAAASPGAQVSDRDASIDQAISAALSAHVQSIVNDARRNSARAPR